jgi:hypothetical protein
MTKKIDFEGRILLSLATAVSDRSWKRVKELTSILAKEHDVEWSVGRIMAQPGK